MNIMLENNPEFRRIIKRISGVFLIFLLIVNIFLVALNNKIIVNHNEKYFNIIGSFIDKNPKIEVEFINKLVEDVEQENIDKGKTILKKYGYDSLSVFNKDMDNLVKGMRIQINLLIAILFCLCIFSIRGVLADMYKFIKKLTNNAEKIVEGNFEVAISDEKEGDIAKLSFQFNQMSKRLKRTVNQLTEEKEFLKDMISNISHQLKTPLASLKMFNELLIEGAIDEKEVAHNFLEKNLVQIDRMEWLIQSLLKITRLETGVIELNKREYNLTVTIKEEVTALKYNANIKGQKLTLSYSDDYTFLEHDRRWMGEAVRNIIKNSIDYTDKGGEINVTLEERESVISVRIKDNGIGIHEKDIPKIFERFYQGKNTHKNNEKRNGTGIGLSLSKVIVEKHGGYIQVNSEVGVGTEFVIIFPKK